MASPSAAARVSLLAISMVLLSSAVMATDFIVGDDKGWNTNVSYSDWAKDKVFRVGDNLVFNYNNSKHNVFKVNLTQYQNCTVPDANEAFTSGKDVIPLSTPGKKWYICGVKNHCKDLGMKLSVNVTDAAAPAPAPSAAPSLLSSAPLFFVGAMLAIAPIFA